MEMCYAAQTNKGIVHVYYEHGVSEPVFDEKTGLPSSKGKELIVLPDPIPHTYPSINVTANTISTTSPPIPTSEPINTAIPTPTTIPPTMPTGKGISGPKHKSHTTASSVSHSKSPPKKMAAPTATAPTVKSTLPQKIMAKPTVATTSKPNPRTKRMGQSTAAPTTKPHPPPKSTAQPTSKPVIRSASQKSRRSDIPKKGHQKLKNAGLHARRPLTRSTATGTFGRASVKGKDPETVFVSLSSEEESSDSYDSYDSVEDEPYMPATVDVSSEKEEVVGKRSIGKKTDAKKRATTDNKEVNEMVEDDEIVCAESGSEDDEFFFGPIPKVCETGAYYDAQDKAYDESDGGESWHSEKMKTPPNSEDELEEVESDEVFPVFREGGRFGELKLKVVGMKFNSKMEFKEAVREYCIQEGRRIWWKKNDNLRMRAVCKGEECGWVVYASRDSEGNCWQIKTFMDDHTCPRETKNRLANRKWLGCKLVRKLRKYPNLRHCEAAQYFKSKCDLDLNKSSLTRALGDARAIVYGDAAAQYGMVRYYGLTLLKTNPGSTVSVGVTPHPNPDEDPTFDRMYICLDGCKRGFKAGCRPLIGLDGAFLKTKYGGQILSAIGQDANNHIYVIAYAIVSIKNMDNWRWFLELLHQDLGDYKQHGWCFISDMQKVCISIDSYPK
ncbi:hypothetical protein Ahy_B03g062571 [Arachis hypogaea]|uniref:Transposase MuDR plant domain-containing protein n=1 Tax=Arachis hypogaea TaxID=3818 RepID=A0A444ZV25_ARAHY|nr:hypothetical protein Ahy_B03g062571 [Arachis hypogaea]